MDFSSRSITEVRQLLKEQAAISEEMVQDLARDPRAGVRALAAREQKRRSQEETERQRIHKLLHLERDLWEMGVKHIAGVDEAGRGPLAGPVVAAAVVLPQDSFLRGLDDSKKLTPQKRESLFETIRENALAVGVGSVDHKEIDRLNILGATLEAMRRALSALPVQPDCVLVDGSHLPKSGYSERAVLDGDARSLSIAAASIIAKVTRDRRMGEYDAQYPAYGFAAHKGYGTGQHLAALKKLGPCEIHRQSFRNVRQLSRKWSEDFLVFQEGLNQATTMGALEGIGRAIKTASDRLRHEELLELRKRYRDRRSALGLSPPKDRKRTGEGGEDAAVRHLAAKGFAIVERNYRSGRGEIDVIARTLDTLAFVEVKAGRTGDFGPPETWVDERKRRQIVQAAQGYLQEHPVSGVDLRFDVIAIDLQKGTLKHIEDAFQVEE